MVSETQTHRLFNGGSMEIERNGRHQYRVENGDWKPSVTTMIDHLDAGAFGFGANWTRKLARYAMFPELEELEDTRREEHRKQTGDNARKEEIDRIQESRLASEPMITHSYEDLLAYVDTAMNVSKSAREEGTKLHEAIEAYINTREIDESNLAFTSWLKEFSTKTFLATELFCYNPELQYGGTIDGIANNENGELERWCSIGRIRISTPQDGFSASPCLWLRGIHHARWIRCPCRPGGSRKGRKTFPCQP